MIKDMLCLGFGSLLSLIFIFCKLTGHITWSWLWVLAPLWGPIGFTLLVVLIASMFLGLYAIIDYWEKA